MDRRMMTPEEKRMEDPIWDKLSCKLEEPYRDIQVDECLKEDMDMVILNMEDNGEALHTVRVEYEWKPLRRGGNNQAVASTLAFAIVPIEFGDNFNVKGHHLSMIKDRQFNGRARADLHKHIAEFIEICGRGTIIQIFYHGLDDATQAILDFGGIVLYKTPNEAYQFLEDRVLLNSIGPRISKPNLEEKPLPSRKVVTTPSSWKRWRH
ncbi:hypothetical protein Tco_0317260 [Tanacetum coccineum]